jgi:hypothetical protein
MNSYGQTLALRKIESARDVGRTGAENDQCWMPVICSIADQARRFIAGPSGVITWPVIVGGQLSDRRCVEWSRAIFLPSEDTSRFRKRLHRARV